MESVLLVVRSRDALSYSIQGDGTVSLSFSLAKNYYFPKPGAAKILKIQGSPKHVYCAVDFIQPQDVGGKLEPILGSSFEATNVYIPLSTNYISSVGWLTLKSVNGTPIKRLHDVTIWIHIVPQDSLDFRC